MKEFINFKELDKIIDEYKDKPAQKAGLLVLKSSVKGAYKDKPVPRKVAERVMTHLASNAEFIAGTFMEDENEEMFDALMEAAKSYNGTIRIVFGDKE